MYFGKYLLEYDKNIDYENPAGRIVTNYTKDQGEKSEILSGDAIDIEIKNTLETFDVEKHKLLLESKNIVEDYNNFVQLHFDKNIEHPDYSYYNDPENKEAQEHPERAASYAVYFRYFAGQLQQNVAGSAVYKNLERSIKTEYHQLDDPNIIKKVVELRLKYIQGMNAILKEIVSVNGKLLGFNSKEIEALITALSQGKTPQAIEDVKEAIVKNRDKFVSKDGSVLDLRSLGGGVFVCAQDDKDHDFNGENGNINILSAIQPCLTYDLVLNGHGTANYKYNYGTYSDDLKNSKRKNIEKNVNENLKKMINNKFSELIDNLNDDNLSMEDYDEDEDGDKEKYIKHLRRSIKNRFIKDAYAGGMLETIDRIDLHNYDKSKEEKFELFFNNYKRDFNYVLNKEAIQYVMKNMFDYINKLVKSSNILKSQKRKELIKNKEEFSTHNSNTEEKDEKGEYKHGYKWTFNKGIKYLDGKVYTDMKQLITIAKNDGFEKILILSCNPAGINLPAKLRKNVTFGKHTIYKESDNLSIQDRDYILQEEYSDIYNTLNEWENQYRILSEEYNIDYDDNQVLQEYYNYFNNQEYLHENFDYYESILYLVEGSTTNALNKILEFIKKVIGFIVSLVKKFIESIKGLLEKVYKFISGKKQNKIEKSPIKVQFISVSNDKADITKSEELQSQKQLEKLYTEQIKNITNVMKKNSDEQVKLNKDMENAVEKLKNNQNKENK